MTEPRPDPYPGYDVLSKRDGLSWDDTTRRVIDARLRVPREPRFLDAELFRVLNAVCARILPQPGSRHDEVPLAAYVDTKLLGDEREGYRNGRLPPLREAWRRGLAALDAEAREAHGRGFDAIAFEQQDALLRRAEKGELTGAAWGDMPAELFFKQHVVVDIVAAYYSHPVAWSEIGYGGPASPRGYVRMDLDRRDTWEAAEARPGEEDAARRKNAHVR
ncbi:MAG: gluconate 2-dehydrogenase subunit 3 family protein [Gluconacetobacter diazotrophicus]|nr:gluconate 2-dehydrogenase subunit 3 family protein [Gluconacetobacter diazotrophicus]